ncbi:hypothetical protein NQ314_005027 [Rhamnusium bicolor]|uniref:Glycoside hydrolase family 38 central domain-containing protein n=1 Tax=Rhamnusium bicolor TaxID=1586634 RepID=A0AAV8ZI29_9CUCU|nr:hypothetical protein NQ314_005027 [Rhamnusium bicolor]
MGHLISSLIENVEATAKSDEIKSYVTGELYALTDLGPEDRVDLNALREAMGVMQHHDAITGTEKEHVAHDYARILSKGIEECEFITASALSKIVAPSEKPKLMDEPVPAIPFISCPLLNVSQCEFSETSDSFVVTIYNPLSRPVNKYIRLPVSKAKYSVRDSSGTQLATQIIPIATPVLEIPGRESSATIELIFQAKDIAPLGFKSYFIEKTEEDIVIEQKELDNYTQKLLDAAFKINEETGLISGIVMNNRELAFKQEFLYYNGFVGNNDTSIEDTNSAFYTDSNGREMLKRIRNFRPTWRLDLEEPISGNYYPVTSKIVIKGGDDEVAVLTDRAQGGTSLKDGHIELMLHRNCLHDDAFGVNEPLIEEAFDRGLVARGSHYLIVGSPTTSNPGGKTAAAQERDLAQKKLLSAWTFLSPTNGLTYDQYKNKYRMEFAGLKRALPDNVQILTLEPWKGFSLLLRLEHVLENDEDPNLSVPAIIDLKNLFSPFEIKSLRETTLGANQWLSENHRLQFETAGNLEDLLNGNYQILDEDEEESRNKLNSEQSDSRNYVKRETLVEVPDSTDNFEITFQPMQIRTFVIEINKNS